MQTIEDLFSTSLLKKVVSANSSKCLNLSLYKFTQYINSYFRLMNDHCKIIIKLLLKRFLVAVNCHQMFRLRYPADVCSAFATSIFKCFCEVWRRISLIVGIEGMWIEFSTTISIQRNWKEEEIKASSFKAWPDVKPKIYVFKSWHKYQFFSIKYFQPIRVL